MGSGESTKRLSVKRSEEDESAGIIRVSERVVRRLRGLEDLPLKGDEKEISQDDINNLWHELQQEKARLKHQHGHFQEFMQGAFNEGRQTEARRWQENSTKLGDKDAQETENHWRQSLEKKDAESKARENKLLEEISVLKEKVADKEEITIEKFNQAVEETKKKFSQPTKVAACQQLKNEVLNCYKQNPTQALKCSQQVRDFLKCVELSQMVSAYRSLKKKCSVVLVNPESVLGYLQGYLLKQECENTEFVWELKRGFEKAAAPQDAKP